MAHNYIKILLSVIPTNSLSFASSTIKFNQKQS